jgi:PAS domain S-box-containing protein
MDNNKNTSHRPGPEGISDNNIYFKKVADLSPNLLFITDLRKSEIIYVNNRVREILGYDPDFIYEKGPDIFAAALHPDDIDRRFENLEKCKHLKDDEKCEIEVRFRAGEKEWHWYKITKRVFQRNEDGSVSHVIGTVENIHDQKVFEKQLKEEHRRFREAQEIGHLGSFERELPGDLLKCSDEFYRILGLEPKPEGLTVEEFMSYVHPHDLSSLREAVDETHATGKAFDTITRIVQPNGNIRHVHRRAAIIRDEEGTPVRVYGTIQDITARIKAEEERKKSDNLIRATETIAGTGSYELDILEDRIYFSDGLFHLFGEEPGEFEPTREWLASRSNLDDDMSVERTLEEAIATKEPYSYTRRIFRKDGEVRVIESHGTVVTDFKGNAVKLIGMVQDITERKIAEEELLKSEERSRNLLKVLQNAPDSYLVLTPDFYIEMASDAYLEATNTKREEIIGKYLFDIFPDNPDLPTASGVRDFKASLQKVLYTGKQHRMPMLQYDVRDRSGAFVEKHWSPTNSPVLNAEGEVDYIIHRAFEVTEVLREKTKFKSLVNETEILKTSLEEIKLQAVQIQKNRTLLQSIFDASPNSIVLFDILYDEEGKAEDFQYAMLNAYNIEHLGFSQELVGKRLTSEFPNVKETGVLEQLKLTAETGKPADFETLYEGDGLNDYFRFRAKKVDNRLVLTSEDITQRKKSEETIQQMLNGSITAITILDALRNKQGNIIDFIIKGSNKAAETLNRVSTEELMGKSLLELFPGVKEYYFDRYVQVVEKGESLRTQDYYDHEHFKNWFDVSAVKNGDGIILTYHDITEQKKAEQELLELKEQFAKRATDKYRKIINSMDEGYCLLEMIYDDNDNCIDYRYLETNPVFEEQSGLRNVLGKTVKEVLPDVESSWLEKYCRVAETGESLRFDDYSESLQRWFDVYTFRMEEEQHVAVIFKDITQRREAEERQTFLLKLNDALRPLEDPNEIQYTTMQYLGKHLEVNRAYYAEVLEDEDTLLAKKGYLSGVAAAPFESKLSDFDEGVRKQIMKGQTLVFNNMYDDLDITEEKNTILEAHRVQAAIAVPLVKNKKLLAVVGIHSSTARSWTPAEVSLVEEVGNNTWAAVERARAENALRASRERLQKVLTIETVGVLFFDGQSNFLDANDAFLGMIGYSREEFHSGKLRSDVITLEQWMPRTMDAFKELEENGLFAPYEKELIRPDGTRWWGLFAGKRLNEKENVEFVVDITHAKKTEEALINARDQAEAATRAKEDFVSTMSHEIRTPLNAVIGLTSLLLEQNPRGDQKENLDSLSFSAQNLLALINDILDFSKLEAGKSEIEQNVFDLSSLVKSLEQLYEPQARNNWSSLHLHLDKDIPELIVTDQLKLSQILHNLVSNAVKFTKNGRIDLTVEVNRRDEEIVWLDFAVEDNGIGVPEKKLKFIFEKFSQAESSTVRQYGGTGLGLTITKLLLELLGSEIQVESREGKGSKFYFSLPVNIATTAQEELVKEEEEEPRIDLSDINLLVVEDVEINRNILRQFFRNWWNLTPDEAVNGKEAVEMARTKKYDLILMDIRMPVMDGYEATELIKNIDGYRDIPILALTADKNQEQQQSNHPSKFNDLLTKPFNPVKLRSIVLSHLQDGTAKFFENQDAEKEDISATLAAGPEETASQSSFDISRYTNLAGENHEFLNKLIGNSLRAMQNYRQDFKLAAANGDRKSLSDLEHKNTTSVYYLQANNLASQIEIYRELLDDPDSEMESLKKQEKTILQEFDEIIEGLKGSRKKE